MVLRLFQSHGLLGFSVPEQWLMVDGGSRAYRDRLIAPFRGSIQLGRPVVRIIRNGPGRGVIVMTAEGATHTFDQVIVTTQADQALRLLVNPTPDESRLLCEFRYEPCTATLHTDESLLPRTPLARAARNFQLTRDSVGRLSSSTHYRMNELQGVSDREDYIVSINRPDAIDPTKIVERIHFAHPLFTPESVRAQIELPKLNEQARGRTETYFAGAYFRDGLHEDAVMSAAQVSGLLLGRDAWAA
jgi:predicted NAD/FAD-binding protein